MDFAFLEPLFSLAAGEWLKNRENRIKFEADLKLFLNRQRQDTHLDIFKFAERPEIRQDEEFIPLEQVYVPLRLKQIHETPAAREQFMKHFKPGQKKLEKPVNDQKPKDIDIVQLLKSLHTGFEYRKVLLIGAGGSGKSTFSKYIARFFATDGERKIEVLREQKNKGWEVRHESVPNHYFPVFLRLRDLEGELKKYNQADWPDNFSLVLFFKSRYALEFETPNFYAQLFRHLPCLFLLDGVDEVPEYKELERFKMSRPQVVQWLMRQVDLLDDFHAKSAFVLTSRPTDMSILARHFQIYEVQPFNSIEINQFTGHWYVAYEKALEYTIRCEVHPSRKDYYQKRLDNLPKNRKAFEKNLNNSHLEGLISNPLLLSQAILIHSIDDKFEIDNVESLYQKFVQTLLYRWDEVRQMDFYPELLGSRNVDNMYRLLRRLAFFFSEREATKLKVREFLPDMVRAIERFKNSLPQPDKISDLSLELLRVFRDRSGILTGSQVYDDLLETEFEFQHKSIQDYLTAVTIADDTLLQNGQFTLRDKVGKPFWDRTIEFYVNVGNPDFFFSDYIENSLSDFIPKMHYFGQYFLLAREKSGDLDRKLGEIAWHNLLHSPKLIEVLGSMLLLSRLDWFPESHAFQLFIDPSNDFEAAYRKGKIGQLYCLKNRYSEIQQHIHQIFKSFTDSPNLFEFEILRQLSSQLWENGDIKTIYLILSGKKDSPQHFLLIYHLLRNANILKLMKTRTEFEESDLISKNRPFHERINSQVLSIELEYGMMSLILRDLRNLDFIIDEPHFIRQIQTIYDIKIMQEKTFIDWPKRYKKIQDKFIEHIEINLSNLRDYLGLNE